MKHISSTTSDHYYVLAELRTTEPSRWPASRRPFRYENVWQSHSQYDQLVMNAWQIGASQNGLEGVMAALTSVQKTLGSCGDREFGSMAKKFKKLQKNLERLRAQSIGTGPSADELSVASQLKEALRQEEIWIKQRSRVSYIRAGDRNTQFFHACASKRRRMNRITSLEQNDGRICDDPEEVKSEILNFYQDLYLSQGYRDMTELLQFVPTRVTEAMNESLAQYFTAEEVNAALFQVAPSKPPGVNGFNVGFFQRHWTFSAEISPWPFWTF